MPIIANFSTVPRRPPEGQPQLPRKRPLSGYQGISRLAALPEGRKDEECSICFDAMDGSQKPTVITACDHVFHQACLEEWVNKTSNCPLCRARFRYDPPGCVVL